jgi:hypothetical protein
MPPSRYDLAAKDFFQTWASLPDWFRTAIMYTLRVDADRRLQMNLESEMAPYNIILLMALERLNEEVNL